MSLINEMRNFVSKEKLGSENYYIPVYSTGFDIVDYRNGRIENGDFNVGINGGKIFTVIGKSGSGKSTFAIQTAINIAKQYEESQIIHLDFERSTNAARIQALSGWDEETLNNKYMLLNRDISTEKTYKLIKGIGNLKREQTNFEKLKIDTGMKDANGDTIYALPPTIVLIDSWATMIPEDIEDEKELSGSMSASSIAKTNNALIKRISGTLESANIILIIINHITQKIEIGFTKTQAQVNYLKQDETLPGGSSCIYLADTLLKLVTSTKLDESDGLGIKGFQVIGEFAKTRSNEAGRKFDMVFSQTNGFSNVLSNFINLKNAGYLKGNGRAYYFDNLPDFKFTQKNFLEKYNESEEFRKAIDENVKELYKTYIPTPDNIEDNSSNEEEDVYLEELVDEENNIWRGSDGNYYTEDGEPVEYEE